GVAVARFRIYAFAIASGFAGLAGAFYAHYIPILTPGIGALDYMALLVVMAVTGGMEGLATAGGGAFVVEFVPETLRGLAFTWEVPLVGWTLRIDAQWRLPFFGLILLLTMRFARNGLLTPLWLQFMRLSEPRDRVRVPAPSSEDSPA